MHAKNILVDVEFMKDGESGDTIVSALESVEVGSDEDGDAITSCVVVPSEAVPAEHRGTRLTLKPANNAGRAGEGREATLKRRMDRASN